MGQLFSKYLKGDKVIWAVVLILSIFSLLAVYSSTGTLAYKYQQGNTEYYFLKHLVILGLGLGIMYAAHVIPYRYYSRISQIAIFLAVPLLLLTLLIGTNINSANRWLTLPIINLSFQTSDFAKLALIMFLARQLSKKQENIKDFKSAFVPIILPVFIVCGLILPANFSTAAILFVTSLIIMFLGRINLQYILLLIAGAAVAFTLFVLVVMSLPEEMQGKFRVETWKARIENFAGGESEENYQATHSKIAIATGGLTGKGPGNSTERNFLPHPYSDFIYAIIVEEYGLMGGLVVLFLYLVLLLRSVRIVIKSEKTFGKLLAFGCAFSLIFQGMINMAVTTNLFPVTGQPLPLLSMGGTSLWFTSIAIGIILSVSRTIEEEETETSGNYAIA